MNWSCISGEKSWSMIMAQVKCSDDWITNYSRDWKKKIGKRLLRTYNLKHTTMKQMPCLLLVVMGGCHFTEGFT